MASTDPIDPIDDLVNEWATTRPDLDFGPMALFARCNRFVLTSLHRLEATLAAHQLSIADFDVLSALRRSRTTFTLKPSELADRVMVTRAGITGRVDRLVERGLVERQRDPDDRRSEPIVLTKAGRRAIDKALDDYLVAQTELFAGLSETQRRHFDATLRRLGAPN